MSNAPRLFVRRYIDAPCKNCSDRFVGCHSTCEKYILFRKNGLTDFIERKKTYKTERMLEDYTVRAMQRMSKK